jgi:hypothetical protein
MNLIGTLAYKYMRKHMDGTSESIHTVCSSPEKRGKRVYM